MRLDVPIVSAACEDLVSPAWLQAATGRQASWRFPGESDEEGYQSASINSTSK